MTGSAADHPVLSPGPTNGALGCPGGHLTPCGCGLSQLRVISGPACCALPSRGLKLNLPRQNGGLGGPRRLSVSRPCGCVGSHTPCVKTQTQALLLLGSSSSCFRFLLDQKHDALFCPNRMKEWVGDACHNFICGR